MRVRGRSPILPPRQTTKKLSIIIMTIMLVFPIFISNSASAASPLDPVPLTPRETNVLVVSPANPYLAGGYYLVSDLAQYGFNVTEDKADGPVNYLTDGLTLDLNQYDVVILAGGYLPYSPTMVTPEEVNHFTDYGGILVVIGNALFANETSTSWPYFWDNFFSGTGAPVQKLEQRLGIHFTSYLKDSGANYYHNNGTFTLVDSAAGGPSSLVYNTALTASADFQVDLSLNGATQVYSFATPEGVTTSGVTFYKNATGATGIFIQGSYMYAIESPGPSISYYGLTDTSKRAYLLASLLASALNADVDTVIKPQPLAVVRLDDLGGWGWSQTYLNTSLYNFASAVNAYNIDPTIRFTDYPSFNPRYWQEAVPLVLSQLKSNYRQWEYSSSLRGINSTSWDQNEVEALIESIRGNYTALGMGQLRTVSTTIGFWNQSTISAMSNQNLSIVGSQGDPNYLANYDPEWWSLSVNSGVILHNEAQMTTEFSENFTETSKDTLHFKYYSLRDIWALATVNGFPGFVFYVPNFRRNEVGAYSLRTVYENLTSEIPDIRFVPLAEAAMYFGNKWMHIQNPARVGSTVEFDVSSPVIPDVVGIGKGMLWLRINSNEEIQAVSIDGKPWYYFDKHSIRIPAPTATTHVKVTLGTSITPRVEQTDYKVIDTTWDYFRFVVTVTSIPRFNVTVNIFVPNSGVFFGDRWNVFAEATQWNYAFDVASRILTFWAIADGSLTFELGPDVVPPVIWRIDQSLPAYNSSVTITANITDQQTSVTTAILSYFHEAEWINLTMTSESGLYTEKIPAFPYGTEVAYRIFASDNIGNWKKSEVLSYTVTDPFPPDIGIPEWSPLSPPTGTPVTVKVSVSEPLFASGVSKVTLWYGLDHAFGTLKSLNMTLENGLYTAAIPGQTGGGEITFLIEAYDSEGNRGTRESYSYTVKGGPLDPFLPFLMGGVIVAIALVGVAVYLIKFRKKKQPKL